MKGKLYLIPTTLGNIDNISEAIPSYNLHIIHQLSIFIVENIRTARRFISKTKHPFSIDKLTFLELGKHTSENTILSYLDQADSGFDIGLLSEAGTPCIADPGSIIVNQAHKKGIEVSPLVGPNSIVLALMASGFNGQNFCFHGYLPVDTRELTRKIKMIESDIQKKDQTQIFIETPFRNNKLLGKLVESCKPETNLCIAVELTLPDQHITTKTIRNWRKSKIDLNKKPAVFLLYK